MGNCIVNLRIGIVHFQIIKDRPYLRISSNDYWKGKITWRNFVKLHQ